MELDNIDYSLLAINLLKSVNAELEQNKIIELCEYIKNNGYDATYNLLKQYII